MTRFTIRTFGPCSRCGDMAGHILVVDGRRVVVHSNTDIEPCPVRPGEMPESGKPVEVRQ